MARQITKPGLTTGQHATIDHTGIPGVGGGEPETFTQEVHDLEDHSSIPGVPAAESFDEAAHALVDHSSQLGVPSIVGLLDETSHDVLNHTGLTGIPAATQFKDNIALEDSLPQNEILDVLGNDLGADNASTSGGKFAYADSWLAVPFTLAGATDSLTLYIKHGGATAAGSNARAKIFSDNAGVPGVELFSDNITIVNDSIKDGPYILSHSLNAGNYWLVLMVTTSSSFTVYSFAKTGKNLYKSINGGTSWTLDASNLSITVSLTSLVLNGYEDGDIVFTEDTNKLHRWDDGTSSWIELNPDETFTGSDHSTTDHTGITGVPSTAGLLDETAHDALSHAGLTGIPAYFIVDEEADLPTIDETNFTGVSALALVDGSSTSEDTACSPLNQRATRAVLASPVSTLTVKARVRGTSSSQPIFEIWDNTGPGGKPGTLLNTYTGTAITNTWQVIEHEFTFETPLAAGTYWIAVAGSVSFGLNFDGTATGEAWIANYPPGDWATYGISENQVVSIVALGYSVIEYSDGDVVFTKDTNKFYRFDLATNSWIELNPDAGDYHWSAPSSYGSLPSSDQYDAQVTVERDSNKLYIYDGDATTPAWKETNRSMSSTNITVSASSWRTFQISLIDRSILNIPNYKCLITAIDVTAIDGNATPDMDYDIELFTNAEMTNYGYWAQNVTDVAFEDKIPFLWEGGSNIYGRIINNKAAAITDLDITIQFRV